MPAHAARPFGRSPDGDGGPARQAVGNPPLAPPISIGEARRDADAGTALYNVDEGLRQALAAKLRCRTRTRKWAFASLRLCAHPEEARATPRDVLLDELAGYYGNVCSTSPARCAGDKRVEAQRAQVERENARRVALAAQARRAEVQLWGMTVTIANAISAGLFCGAPRLLLVDPKRRRPRRPRRCFALGTNGCRPRWVRGRSAGSRRCP